MNMDTVSAEDIFRAVYARHFRSVVALIYRIIGDYEVSREIGQDVFIKVYRNIDKISEADNCGKYYIFAIARNMAIDHLRRKHVENARYREVFLEEVMLDAKFYEDIENCVIRGEIISTLHDTINEFPEAERHAYIGRNLENRTFNNIRESSNISFYRMKKIEKKVQSRIRKVLGPYFQEN